MATTPSRPPPPLLALLGIAEPCSRFTVPSVHHGAGSPRRFRSVAAASACAELGEGPLGDPSLSDSGAQQSVWISWPPARPGRTGSVRRQSPRGRAKSGAADRSKLPLSRCAPTDELFDHRVWVNARCIRWPSGRAGRPRPRPMLHPRLPGHEVASRLAAEAETRTGDRWRRVVAIRPGRTRWRTVTFYSSGSQAMSWSKRRRSPSSSRESIGIRPYRIRTSSLAVPRTEASAASGSWRPVAGGPGGGRSVRRRRRARGARSGPRWRGSRR